MYGHDYAVPGTYEVTMVVAGRRPVFGEIVGTTKNDGEKPHLKPIVETCWSPQVFLNVKNGLRT